LIKKAWETRDAAVKRKNNTEIELAKTRIYVMQVNSQLMEAVQQKVSLSQQLDQWQQDVQELLEENMNKKMANNIKSNKSGAESDSSQPERKKSSRLLSFLKLAPPWHQTIPELEQGDSEIGGLEIHLRETVLKAEDPTNQSINQPIDITNKPSINPAKDQAPTNQSTKLSVSFSIDQAIT